MTSSAQQPLMTQVKADIADAAIRVIARDGFDVISIRTVAKEARLAAGTVQYHFPTRNELLVGAIVRNGQRQLLRIGALPEDTPVAERLIQALSELLPLDEERREECALWVAMGSAASTRKSLADQYLAEIDLMRHLIRRRLMQADREGTLRAGITPDQGAYIIAALTNGLVIDGLNAPPQERERIRQALDSGIRLLVGSTR